MTWPNTFQSGTLAENHIERFVICKMKSRLVEA